jgi:eukaryotic-like serine/threonine-protein kinase
MVQAPRQLGDFEIVRELGRGGMGVVYEAVQTSLGRRVALKVLGAGLGLTPRAVDRFRREAAAAAKLHHSNIVPVYATGEQEGTHFYAMELIDGPSLDAVVRQLRSQANQRADSLSPELGKTSAYTPPDPLSTASSTRVSAGGSSADRFDRVAAMIAAVADALHHAHQQGVTHRDIKPSNLMLSSDGRLSVTDFGLARMLEQPGMTVTGEFVGTPAYMSPEQITAGRIPVDHRTDIYSLGATLYELLTLRPPFAADGRDKLLAMVIQKEPPAPRSVEPKVPRDLETICLKCLEKDPDRRYLSGKELADDLQRFINRFAILAKRAGPLARAKKWIRRNPALTAAGLVVLLAVGVAGFFAWRAHEAEQTRQAEEVRRADEQATERRRVAIERGMTAALAADFPAAERAVADAEQLGASAGETRLLRGFIALANGRTTEAVGHFEQAVRLMPDSVSARALLAKARCEAGDWMAGRQSLDEAARMTVRTTDDKFFLGLALSLFQ